MPVSLSEWRVRIGTFVHWIREYEVKERRERLLKERIRRLKVLCERLEVKRDDSGEEFEDDKSRQNGPDPKGCPHKTANIRSSGNSSDIKDLLTSCDQCIQDLLTASDFHIKEILTSSGCSIKELITPNDCSITSPNTLNGSTIKALITPNESGIKELVTTNDSRIKNLVKANDDSRIQDLVKANDDSRIQDLLTTSYCSTCIRDPITPKYCSIKDVIVSQNAGTKPLDTPNDSSTKELTSLNASSIKDLITPNDSSIIDLITSEYSNIKDIIISNDSKIDSLLTPNETNIKWLIQPDNDYIEEQLAQAYDYVKTVHTSDDESIKQDTQVGDSDEQHMSNFSISTRHSLSDASLRELLTSSYPSTKDLWTLTDDLNADLIIETSYINNHETQSDCSVRDLSSPGSETTVCTVFAPCDDFLVELLKQNVSAGKDLPSIDLCCHETDRRNEPFSEESGKLPYFVGKEQHPDTFTKEPTDDELLKEHQTSSGSCKKSQTETSILMAVDCSPAVPIVSRKYCISDRYGEKQMGESASSCHGPSLKSKTDLISGQIPPLSELLLLKSGDVELNPGPREAAGWSLELERDMLSLVEDVPSKHYTRLCNALGVKHAQSQEILSKNLLDVSNSLFEVICGWGVKQRDGTNYKTLLAEKLRSVHLDAFGTKLIEGGYSTQDTPTQWDVDRQDTPQPVVDMSEDEVIQCGEDLNNFYREHMCKIKTEPFDFQSIREFEQIYTNLVLQRRGMTKTRLDYSALLTTTINGVLPKRLLIEGEGGVGKTTFCSKIAWDWIKGSPEFQRFSWVLVIPLRNVVKGQTIGDIMKDYLSDNNSVSSKQIDNYILSQPTKVLIVLDGLDEYDGDLSAKESSDISQILRLEKFKQCIVLVTTRPWRADQIKSNEGLSRSYAFIAVEGFGAENVSTYISKYFVDDEKAGSELIRFIEVNDVIKENMAPFPIYVAMLCILWQNCDSEKRDTVRRLKTFSQLFHQMILFLREHYVSKVAKVLQEAHLEKDMTNTKLSLQRIGAVAFSGLLRKKLVFNEEEFSLCNEAMETCCRIGVLSRENRNVSRWKRTLTPSQPITTSVFFSHKLFQEYIASLYLASLYDTNYEEYSRSMGKILSNNPLEFRYLFYFTAALGKEVGLDIVKKIQLNTTYLTTTVYDGFGYEQPRRNNMNFLVDVTFEAYNKDTAKAVGRQIFANMKMLIIDDDMPAHTISGYLFIMEHHGMETLVFRDRSCGPTVSRDLADFLFVSNSLSRLEFYCTTLDDDFYQLMQTRVSTMEGVKSSIKELVVDHQFLNGLQRFNIGDFNVTLGDLFPSLTQLTFTTLHTVSPGDVERLAHSSLAVLSIEHGKKGGYLVPLIGEPTSLGQLCSSAFPQLACLTFRELVMGNIRSEAILRNLKNHLHLKSISIISCFTDDELDSLAEQITTENRMKITLQHDMAQRTLSIGYQGRPLTIDMIDALCHRTCVHQLDVFGKVVKIAGKECFPDFHGREVASKLAGYEKGVEIAAEECFPDFHGREVDSKLAGFEKGIEIRGEECFPDFHGREVDSKIHMLNIGDLRLRDNQSASCCLGKFLSLLPHLTALNIHSCSLHDDFYKEIVERASSSQGDKSSIKELVVDHQFLNGLQMFNNGDINVTVEDLFPNLTQLTFTTHHTVSPGVVERLAHSSLAVLSIEHGEEGGYLVSLIGEPTSLGQLFSTSFPQLTCLTFQELVMGNIRSEAILLNLKNHLHLKSISIISCFTDDELDPLAEQINTENRMDITLQHNMEQRTLSFDFSTGPLTIDMIDALCHGTCVRQLAGFEKGVEIAGEECFPDLHGREVDSKIWKCIVIGSNLHNNQSASCCLGKFLRLLSHLTDLEIRSCSFHDDFYKEIAVGAFSSPIQKFMVHNLYLHDDQSEFYCPLGKFLSLLPHLTDLKIDSCSFHDDFYREIADKTSSSQIQKFMVKNLNLCDDQSASYCLGKFLSVLSHLTDLNIDSCSLHDDFYKEIADRASSSQIQMFKVYSLNLGYDQSASYCLGKFLSLLPHLTDMTIYSCSFHDDFYKEIADHASSSQIQKFMVQYLKLHNDQSASCSLGKFLSLLPHLTDLNIDSCYLHDDFYKEIADRTSSSQIQKFMVQYLKLHNDRSASCSLGKFLSLLPHLTDLNIDSCSLHDDFYKEIADRTSSSQIQTVDLDFNWNYGRPVKELSHSASKQLAKFLCSLPCLTNLTINMDEYLYDDFFTELDILAASSQNPYFREKQHISMLQEWSARQQQQQQLNQFERQMTSTHQQPYLPHHVPLLESARPSGQFQSFYYRGIQSEPGQINQSPTYQQHSPMTPFQSTFAHQLTKQHLEEFDQYLQSYLSAQHNASNGHGTQYSANLSYQETQQHLPHYGLGEATWDNAVSQRQEDATPLETDETSLSSSSGYINYLTSVYQGGLSIGMKPIYENDDNLAMPSTSGLSSAQSRTDAAPVESKQIPEHRKRIHSDDNDDGDRVDESLEQRPGKRRAKTDRKPTSP